LDIDLHDVVFPVPRSSQQFCAAIIGVVAHDPAKADITLGQLLSMSAGLHGEGSNPRFVNGVPSVKLTPQPRAATSLGQDLTALRTPLWTKPGGGYSYVSASPHVASIVLRNLTGMELHEYIDQPLAKPLGWGQWAWARRRGENALPHTPGGADIALRSTDHLRFVYAILKKGRWGKQQVIPADYIDLCGKTDEVEYPCALDPYVGK
jgi:CubicO group peptidase (beta-lactamase class C family)